MPLGIEKQLLALGSEWRRSTPPSLRARVADIAYRAPSAGQDVVRPAGVSSAWIVGRKMAVATAGVIVVLLVVPFSRDAIARQAYRFLQSIDIAPNTKLVTSAPRTADEGNTLLRQSYRELGAGRVWQVHTRYGSFGGGVPPNASPDVRRIDQIDTLREAASIPLLAPEGPYRRQPVPFDHAMLTPDGLVLAFFGTGNAEVMLVEAPVDRGQQMAFSRSVTGRGGVGSVPGLVEKRSGLTLLRTDG